MNWNETKQFLSPCFPEEIQAELDMLLPGELREIRIRAERTTMFVTASRTAALPWVPSQRELEAIIEALSEHSLYARGNETGQGFLTLRGGHRMGLCGRVSISDQRSVLTDIGSVCIRIASEWLGAAAPLFHYLSGAQSILIVGVPGAGKTTMLRDLARQFSARINPLQLAVVDERSELAACVNGIPQLDIGSSTDVLDGLPKAEAIHWLLRSMKPDVIITDELGSEADVAAVTDAISCGAAVCASIHGTSLQEAAKRPALAALMARRPFDLYAVLSPEGGGHISGMYDRLGSPLPLQ